MMLFVGIAIVVVAVIGTVGCFATVMYVLAKERRLPVIWRKSAYAPVTTNAAVVCLYSQTANARDWQHRRDFHDVPWRLSLEEINRPEQLVINGESVLDAMKITAISRQSPLNLLEYSIVPTGNGLPA